MSRNYIFFVVIYDFNKEIEQICYTCEGAYAIAKAITDGYIDYVTKNHLDAHYESLISFCEDWFKKVNVMKWYKMTFNVILKSDKV